MKKIVSLFLLLSITIPTIPMQRTKELIKKYAIPTLEISAGAAALGLSAYGLYRYSTDEAPHEKLHKLDISGPGIQVQQGTFCGGPSLFEDIQHSRKYRKNDHK